jgi:hypothetical protein
LGDCLIMSFTINGEGELGGTQSVQMPSGNTANRPASPDAGEIRFNTDTGEMEFWSTTSSPAQWRKVRQGQLPALSVRYLVAAGGGAGGGTVYGWVSAGGGGAGGYLAASNDTSTFSLGTAYTVTVGTGGPRNTTSTTSARTQGADGTNSVLHTLTAIGGGGGGPGQMGSYNLAASHGRNGGSGGGVGGYGNSGTGNVPGTGTAGQGNNGGGPSSNPWWAGGGGGGAGGVGANADTNPQYYDSPGIGGAGVSNDITGTAIFYCAGGGGGSYTTTNTAVMGVGGSNGAGGRGGFKQAAGQYASRVGQTPGSGGGGGGGHDNVLDELNGGAGADGVVIIRIPDSYTATFSAGITYTSTNLPATDENVYQCTAGTGTVTFAVV